MVRNEEFHAAPLDDENVGGLVAFPEDQLTGWATRGFQAAKDFFLLTVGDTAEDRDVGHHR